MYIYTNHKKEYKKIFRDGIKKKSLVEERLTPYMTIVKERQSIVHKTQKT